MDVPSCNYPSVFIVRDYVLFVWRKSVVVRMRWREQPDRNESQSPSFVIQQNNE